MDWGKIAKFFTLEAVATYIVALGTLAYWLYQAWKSKQGRHVVCTMTQPEFSHLTLSYMASKWVEVEFTGEDQSHPTRIDTLSQVIIDIKNDSATDVLNDINLEFHAPQARVLRVWWEEAPEYLVEQSKLGFASKGELPGEEERSIDPSSKVQIFLAQLKSWKKYQEEVRVGILADGQLESISMIPQGSEAGVPPDQVWTARFITFKEFQRRSAISASFSLTSWTMVFGVALVSFTWLILRVFGPVQLGSITLGAFNWDFLLGLLLGFVGAVILGYVSQQLLLARDRTQQDSLARSSA